MLVVDTRVSHALVDGGYASRRADCETACRELGVPSLREATLDRVESLADSRIRRRARHVVTEIDRVAGAVEAVERSDWPVVGELLRRLARLDARRLRDLLPGARRCRRGRPRREARVGARMTGGGFGGSAVALVPEDVLDAVTTAVDA